MIMTTKHKFNIGDIISNGQAVYRVGDITKNCIGQDCYFLVNVEHEKNGTRYLGLTDSEGEHSNIGEITLLCEQVDKSFEKQCEQKSAWSEEDESMRRHLTLILMELGVSRVKYSTVPKYHFDREIEWLCNLHPQPKEEWSKKDETIKLDWLKSLFPQKQWKPSDEQIKVCKEAFIKKAVEWLSRHFYDEEYQSMDNEGVWICADELIDDFKEYMKGE